MEPIRICMIRHGETDWNRQKRYQGREDIPLNESGRAQAHTTAETLLLAAANGDVSWGRVLSSPLSRAKETADIIAAALHLPPAQTLDGLIERDFGKISGMSREAREDCFASGDTADIEPYAQVGERVARALIEAAAAQPQCNMIVVSHGGAINAFLAHATGGAQGKCWLDNGCASLLTYANGKFTPLAINLDREDYLRFLDGLPPLRQPVEAKIISQ